MVTAVNVDGAVSCSLRSVVYMFYSVLSVCSFPRLLFLYVNVSDSLFVRCLHFFFLFSFFLCFVERRYCLFVLVLVFSLKCYFMRNIS